MKAQMFNHSRWVLETDPDALRTKYDVMLHKAGFTIEDTLEKHFEPFGWTALWLLSESHFAVHTFPEEGKSYIEISSCIEGPYRVFMALLNK